MTNSMVFVPAAVLHAKTQPIPLPVLCRPSAVYLLPPAIHRCRVLCRLLILLSGIPAKPTALPSPCRRWDNHFRRSKPSIPMLLFRYSHPLTPMLLFRCNIPLTLMPLFRYSALLTPMLLFRCNIPLTLMLLFRYSNPLTGTAHF